MGRIGRHGTAPAGHHGDVLHAVELIGRRARDDPGLGVEGPQLLAGVVLVGGEVVGLRALEHQAALGRQHPAVEVLHVRRLPHRLLGHRVPGQQEGVVVAVGGGVAGVGVGRVLGRRHRGREGACAGVEAEPAAAGAALGRVVAVGEGALGGGDVNQAALGAVGHRLPVVGATGAGDLHEGLAGRPVARFRDLDRAAVGVQALGPVHDRIVLALDELPGLAVQHVEEAVLGRVQQGLAHLPVDLHVGQDDRLGRGVVPAVAGRFLEVPDVFAGLRLQGHDRAEEQVVAAAGAAHLGVPGRAVAAADVEQVEVRIIGHAVPRRAAAAVVPPVAMPGGIGDLHGLVRSGAVVVLLAGDHVELPLLLAGLGVVAGHEAAGAELRAAVADDHNPLDHARGARDRKTGGLGEGLGRPDLLAGLGVERDQAAVERADIDLVLPDGHAPVHRAAAGVDLPGAGVRIEAPQVLAGARVERPHLGEVGRDVDHPVMDDRGRLEALAVAEVEVPGQAQVLDGRGVDLVEGAEALLAVVAPVPEPLARRGASDHLAVDALVAGDEGQSRHGQGGRPRPLGQSHDRRPPCPLCFSLRYRLAAT